MICGNNINVYSTCKEYRNDKGRSWSEIATAVDKPGGFSSSMLSSHRGVTAGRGTGGGSASAPPVGGAGPGSSSLLEIDPVILIQLLDLKERSSVESLWGLQPRPPVSLLHSQAHAHSRKERERRPQVVRRSAPDSGVLIRLKAQMAEVRSKMADVKSQVLETRESGEPRPGPSGGFGMEEASAHSASSELPACHKGDGLEQVGRAAVTRSKACRPTRKSLSPVLDSSGGPLLVKRRSSEDMKDDLRGAESAAELSPHPKDGTGAGEGELQSEATSGPLVSLSSSSSDQASPSTKQKCSAEKQLYAASGPRDEIFSLGGLSYITASKACSGRTLGATVLECELESSRNSHQSLLEGISAPAQSNEDQSSSVLMAATSSDSDTEDEALQSSNSRYDNHTPPCTGEPLLSDDNGLPAIR